MSADTETLILEELRQVRKELAELKLSKKVTPAAWVSEAEALEIVGLVDGKHFRKQVRTGKINISYRTTNGRAFQYSRKSIDRYLHESSNEL